ncbi:hypothetical protein [Pseudorhodoferax sp.]|uniref:hypothetical protein n=1 Tax=Pseudorhodoferax sp. TaxID=1993553 RepID=UPI002DD69EEA|nr:hypothetical protein [Pseudorhodoferax sp.]
MAPITRHHAPAAHPAEAPARLRAWDIGPDEVSTLQACVTPDEPVHGIRLPATTSTWLDGLLFAQPSQHG